MPPDHLYAKPAKADPTPAAHSHSDAYVTGFSDGLEQAARDISITHSHRTALRRIIAGEPVGDLAHVLGSLYLHELVDDDMVHRQPFVTPLGLELLAAHDRLAATVRRERPRLVSRPLPAGWGRENDGLRHADLGFCIDHEGAEVLERRYRARAEAYAWLLHERAVRAQDGGS